MQGLVDLVDDHRREIGRVGFEAHSARERQQDLACVVLFAKETLVEPQACALTVHERHGRGDDEGGVECGAARRDLRQRRVAFLHEREREGNRRQENQQGERTVGERVLEAAPQHNPWPEHMRDADGVNQPECRQQDQTVEDDPQRPGVIRRIHLEELRDNRDAVADRVGEDARDRGVERHADAAPLISIVVEAVAVGAFGNGNEIDSECDGERREVDARVGGVPHCQRVRRLDSRQIQAGHERRTEERHGGQERHGMQPGVSVEQAGPSGEVEDCQGNRRKRERARDPRKDGEHLLHDGNLRLLAKQRAAAAHGTEGERQDTEPSGEVVAPHQQEQQRRPGEDHRLHDHAEVASCPSVGVRFPHCRSVQRREEGRALARLDDPLDRAPDSHPIEGAPERESLRLAGRLGLEQHC